MGEDVTDVLVAVFSIVVCAAQIVLAVAGLFGHSVILFATYKTKEIQTKYGLLLVQLSVAHIICILGQLLNTAFIVDAPMLNSMMCFQIFSYFLATMMWQSLIVLVISIDLLCAIVIPLIYRKWSVRMCVAVNVAACGLLSTAYTLVSYFATDTNGSRHCDLYSVQEHSASSHVEIASYCIAALQVLIYLTCYMIMYVRAKIFMRKNKNACFRNQHRKTMRTISMLVVIYVCTWVLSIVLTHVMRFVSDLKWRRLLGMVTSVLQMMCFAQTFYVCYQRSSEYRNTFRRLLKSIHLLGKIKCHIKGYRNPACHPEKPPQIRTISFVTAI